jgi:hypothetical protein
MAILAVALSSRVWVGARLGAGGGVRRAPGGPVDQGLVGESVSWPFLCGAVRPRATRCVRLRVFVRVGEPVCDGVVHPSATVAHSVTRRGVARCTARFEACSGLV